MGAAEVEAPALVPVSCEREDSPASPPLPPPSAAPPSPRTAELSCAIRCDWLASLDLAEIESLELDLWTLARKFGLREARLDCLSITMSAPEQESLCDAKEEFLNGVLEFYKSHTPSVDKPGQPLDEADAIKERKREDPSDGSLWAWAEFKARYEAEFGLEATTEYWNSMPVHREAEKSQRMATEHEARRDPADGSPWTWPEFKARYEGEYGLEVTAKYWKSMPLSTDVKSPATRAGAECHVRHRW